MQAPAIPDNEAERLHALSEYQILDTLPEQSYDDITQLAAYICNTPIALVSLVDASRQWFKSKVGIAEAETPREMAFCAHTLLHPDEMLMVPDTLTDPRFADNPLVVGAPYIRFYAGVPLVSSTGSVLGTLCVIDTQPRKLDLAMKSALSCLARQVMTQLELRKSLFLLQRTSQEKNRLNDELAAHIQIDALTQTNNRRALQRSLMYEWERAFRYSKPLSLLMLDIDELASYNREFGREAGDQVLRQVSAVIKREARQPDFVGRYGDDEFVIVLPETDSEGVLKIAERIRYKIEQERWQRRPVTISVGAASYGSQVDAEAFLDQAGRALALAKQAGRNCVMGDF